ncbi:MAG: tRNA (adenosine(37)-N6)-threonylcarbamoyltransferase complex dimerization subunit type 1 TsaB [Rhodospirillaceae bacterium]|nr:tRNA (adenosine(37)-N6)-threonylcarbamoyltransferase complex dimerization subunit type 1 TsaB [Rhodospirillaceae bacterium]
MLVLAFDTTAAACSVALVKDGAALAHIRELMDQGQAEILMPQIEEVMAAAGHAYDALDRIAVTIGPGSFTGVRVGLSTARALGLAAGKPVIGINSLEAIAAAVPEVERRRHAHILTVVDTKRGDVYAQSFTRDLAPCAEPVALAPADIGGWLGEKDVVVTGDGTAMVLEHLQGATPSAADPLPDAVVLARLAATRTPDPAGPLPLYVLPPKITLAPHGGKLRP